MTILKDKEIRYKLERNVSKSDSLRSQRFVLGKTFRKTIRTWLLWQSWKILMKKKLKKLLWKQYFVVPENKLYLIHLWLFMFYPKIFLKVIGLVRKAFYFDIFFDSWSNRKNKKSHESVRDHYENAKLHLGFCNKPSNIFCNVCEVINPRKHIWWFFFTKEYFKKS